MFNAQKHCPIISPGNRGNERKQATKENNVKTKRPQIFLSVVILAMMAGSLRAAEIKHKFICVDNGNNRLIYVDQLEPENSWSVSIAGGSRDLQRIGEDRILVGHGDGAAEYAIKDGKLLWRITNFKSVQTARRLGDGNTLLGIDNGPFLIVNRKGEILKEIKMPNGVTQHLRLARVLVDGNILFAAGTHITEADQTGNIIKQFELVGKAYTAERLENGHTIATAGGALLVQQFNAAGEVVHSWGGQTNHPNVEFAWFSGFDLLQNGNIMVANWRGHGYKGDGPHLVELDAENQVVWTWDELSKAKYVTNVLVLQ